MTIVTHSDHSYSLQIIFNPQGNRLLTASSDKTARLWDPITGECLQVYDLIFNICSHNVTVDPT